MSTWTLFVKTLTTSKCEFNVNTCVRIKILKFSEAECDFGMWMIGESKKERKPVIFQNVQFSPKCSSQSVNPCLQSWTQWTNFFVEFWWKISHVHDLRGECTFLLYSSSSILPVKNLFHKLYRFWECPFCSPPPLSLLFPGASSLVASFSGSLGPNESLSPTRTRYQMRPSDG